MLVVIGVVLFIAGGGIAFVTVNNSAKKNATTPTVVVPATTPAVVAGVTLAAGTTGQDMLTKGSVSVQLIPKSKYVATDIPNLQALNDQVLAITVQKGAAITTADLTPSTSVISVPAGLDAQTVTVTGVDGLAGYLPPGSLVDVYADIDKLSALPGPPSVPQPTNLAVPCTELTMQSVEVLDVSNTVPPYAPPATGAAATAAAAASPTANSGRSIPPSLTLLLALTPEQARETAFMQQNETLSVVQTQKDTAPPPIGVCEGTGQYSLLP
jgi:Flp pilus assembly protein CpaB